MTFFPGGRRRPYRQARVRIIGCGPGCLLTSLLLSIALTVLLNLLVRIL